MQPSEIRHSRKVPILLTFAIAGLLGLGILGVQTPAARASSSSSYDNIQLFVQTTQTNGTFQYVASAYNSSGGLVATSQSQYPAFSFELPSDTYLFTVSATQQSAYPGPIVYNSQSSGSATPLIRYWGSGYAEYGYLLQKVDSSGSYTITTKSLADIGLTDVTITVTYPNGTAADQASVSASLVGAYYWAGDNNAVMWNQTGSDGVATLRVPNLPALISAYASVSVILPKNETTTQVTVAGQTVNVTVYWQPMYVEFMGSALVMPPSTSASIVLQAYQPSYYPVPYGVATASGSGVVSPQTGSAISGAPSSSGQNGAAAAQSTTQGIQNQIPALTLVSTKTVSQAPAGNELLSIGVVAAIVIAALSMAVVVLRKK
jgi:hypothetical protein